MGFYSAPKILTNQQELPPQHPAPTDEWKKGLEQVLNKRNYPNGQ